MRPQHTNNLAVRIATSDVDEIEERVEASDEVVIGCQVLDDTGSHQSYSETFDVGVHLDQDLEVARRILDVLGHPLRELILESGRGFATALLSLANESLVEQEVVTVHHDNYEWVTIHEVLEIADVISLLMLDCRVIAVARVPLVNQALKLADDCVVAAEDVFDELVFGILDAFEVGVTGPVVLRVRVSSAVRRRGGSHVGVVLRRADDAGGWSRGDDDWDDGTAMVRHVAC